MTTETPEGVFRIGERVPQSEAVAHAGAAIGARVMIVAGASRKRTGIVIERAQVAGPSGSTYPFLRVRLDATPRRPATDWVGMESEVGPIRP